MMTSRSLICLLENQNGGKLQNNFFCSYFFEISNTTYSFQFFMVVIYFYIRSTEIKLRKERAPKIIPETTM
jgi:hypothetical protein